MNRALLSWKSLAIGLLALVFLGAAVPTLVGENPPKQPPLKAKVFRLNHCDPTEIEQVLQGLLDPSDPPMSAAGIMGPQVPAGAVPGPGGFAGVGGIGGLGALGIGGFGGGTPSFQVSVDSRTRSLVVRASEKNLQLTADLIAVLDLPKNKPVPEVKSLRVFTLKHAEAEELMNTLQAAGVEARMVALGEAKMLVVAGTEEAMKEVGDLVKDLDVPTPPEPKPEEQRRLFGGKDGGVQ